MTYRSSPATSHDLERALRAEQRAHRRTRLILRGVSAAALALVFAVSVLYAHDLAELRDSLYWSQRRGDFWHARATEVRPWRDWVRPSIETVKP